MARRGRGRSRNLVSASEEAEFFKVFQPHRNSEQLEIPPDFLKEYKRTINEKVILKDYTGKMWHVDVKETPDGVFLENGWQNFVSYHCLKFGEFLVFRYDKCYSFVVKIFGRSGCKKEALAAENIARKVKIEKEMEATQTSNKLARPENDGPLLRDNGRTRQAKRSREVIDLEEQNVDPELPENSDSAEGVLPEHPYFVSPPILSRKYKLRIPDEVIDEHDLHFEPEMMLRNAAGEEWRVRIFTLHDNGPTFIGSGWLAFQVDNDVGLNDRCRFTFTTESRVIIVQILRARSNTLRKTRRRG